MQHHKKGKKFGRTKGKRAHFLRNLVNDLVRCGRIETTEARAKAIRPITEKLVSIAKKQDLAHRRLLVSRMGNRRIAQKMYEEFGPKYQSRPGGYTRIIKLTKA